MTALGWGWGDCWGRGQFSCFSGVEGCKGELAPTLKKSGSQSGLGWWERWALGWWNLYVLSIINTDVPQYPWGVGSRTSLRIPKAWNAQFPYCRSSVSMGSTNRRLKLSIHVWLNPWVQNLQIQGDCHTKVNQIQPLKERSQDLMEQYLRIKGQYLLYVFTRLLFRFPKEFHFPRIPNDMEFVTLANLLWSRVCGSALQFLNQNLYAHQEWLWPSEADSH